MEGEKGGPLHQSQNLFLYLPGCWYFTSMNEVILRPVGLLTQEDALINPLLPRSRKWIRLQTGAVWGCTEISMLGGQGERSEVPLIFKVQDSLQVPAAASGWETEQKKPNLDSLLLAAHKPVRSHRLSLLTLPPSPKAPISSLGIPAGRLGQSTRGGKSPSRATPRYSGFRGVYVRAGKVAEVREACGVRVCTDWESRVLAPESRTLSRLHRLAPSPVCSTQNLGSQSSWLLSNWRMKKMLETGRRRVVCTLLEHGGWGSGVEKEQTRPLPLKPTGPY